MTASFPSSVKQFTRKRDLLDIVLAADINQVYDEVTAIEQKIGVLPATNIGFDQGSYSSSTLVWDTLRDRIQNIDYGVYVAYTDRVKSSGGSVIEPSGINTINLSLKSASGQTANQLSSINSSGITVFTIDADGYPKVSNSPVVYENGVQTLSNKTLSGTNNTFTDIPAASVTVVEGNSIRQYVDSRPTIIYSPTEPTGQIPGTIWVDSSENVDPFDSSGLLLKNDPSVAVTEAGYRKMYASTEAPTIADGADGDLWLQYVN